MAQQGGGGSPPSQEGGNTNDTMFVMVFFVAVLVVIWMTRIYWFPIVFQLKYLELSLVNYFVNVDPNLYKAIFTAQYFPSSITTQDFILILNLVGNYYKYPIAIILAGLALYTYIKNPGNKFNKTYSMTSFRLQETENWPQIIPATKVDLIKTSIHEGPWASSLTPMQFAKKYQLLDIIVNENPNPLLGELAKTAKLREGRARQVFAEQLGYIWQTPESLPIHTKALYAVFLAIANKDRKSGHDLLKQFNESMAHRNIPNFKGVDALLKKHQDCKYAKIIEKRHAYVMTVLAAALEMARADGVLPTADFTWLKTIDRKLWYMLNNVGRRAAFPEVAGAIAHWRIESRMQKKLVSPMIEEAVKALKIALEEIIYQEEEDE